MFFMMQPALPGFGHSGDHGRNLLGRQGEINAYDLLARAGYRVRKSFARQGDLTAVDSHTGQIWRVEVKTARRCVDGKWRFLLWKRGRQDHRHADVVLLIAVLDDGRAVFFTVPTAVLANQRQAVITSHPDRYAGKLARYRQSLIRLPENIEARP